LVETGKTADDLRSREKSYALGVVMHNVLGEVWTIVFAKIELI
jgi:hypothetical protein